MDNENMCCMEYSECGEFDYIIERLEHMKAECDYLIKVLNNKQKKSDQLKELIQNG